MSNKVKKAANKFYRQLKGNITFERIEAHLKKHGYRIIFFNAPLGDAELQRYKLSEKAQKTKAFTYCCTTAKIVFINNLLSVEDKFYLLLHETAHIVLKHLEPGSISMHNGLLLDIDADAFVHCLLNPQQGLRKTAVVSLIIAVVIIIGLIFYRPVTKETTTVTVGNSTTQSQDMVYITSTGSHFHSAGCGSITSKITALIERDEALKIHTPCNNCNP